ncbi:MAG: flagellar biosynthetic protein FliR [Candidatus Lambdaproteobacteria bacterium]|nr:flagellar biosynthetic protein FliR [Candidatus Lambdaproteobacteria bacterium]
MPNLLQFNPGQFLGFFLVFTRISGVTISAPLLSDATIPPVVKVLLGFLLSLVFYPVLAAPRLGGSPDLAQLTLLVLGELAVGLLIGFAAQVLFEGVQLAGEVVGFQMGLGIAHVFDPTSEEQVPLIAQVQTTFAFLLFTALDGHHMMIRTLAGSYAVVGVGGMQLGQPALEQVVSLVRSLFIIGIQVGAPLTVALLAANLSMGLVARAVPQVNIFVVGFPFTIGLGLLLLALGFPFYLQAVAELIQRLEGMVQATLRSLG